MILMTVVNAIYLFSEFSHATSTMSKLKLLSPYERAIFVHVIPTEACPIDLTLLPFGSLWGCSIYIRSAPLPTSAYLHHEPPIGSETNKVVFFHFRKDMHNEGQVSVDIKNTQCIGFFLYQNKTPYCLKYFNKLYLMALSLGIVIIIVVVPLLPGAVDPINECIVVNLQFIFYFQQHIV